MNKNDNQFDNAKTVVTGRAASAIYLILKNLNLTGTRVLVPVNICYAAVYPILYAGYHPQFCDIDSNTGNVTMELIDTAEKGNVSAMIIPHMYGNPVSDIFEIKKYCVKNNIVLIEDCASAMGANVADQTVGCFGNYAIYSTGYSKTIDIGNGGLLTSDNSLESIRQMNNELPVYREDMHTTMNFFSKLYRLIRNSGENSIVHMIYRNLGDACKENFLYKLPENQEQAVMTAICNLDEVISERRRQAKLYRLNLDFTSSFLTEYQFSAGAVPWRYNIFVQANVRKELIAQLLDKQIPVSDWYPPIGVMFEDNGVYQNAENMASELLNFPLLIEDEKIIHICTVINDSIKKLGTKL